MKRRRSARSENGVELPDFDAGSPSAIRAANRGLGRGEYTRVRDNLVTALDSDIRAVLDSMAPEDRRLAMDIIRDIRDTGGAAQSMALNHLWEIDYKWQPVPIEQYLDDPYYLGQFTETLFPQWRTDLRELFKPGATYHEWLMGGCFTGDTRIALLDGTTPTLEELTARGGDFWVYSCDDKGNVVPGRGHSARITKRNQPLVEVGLDNGTRTRCTPDHLWLMRDGTWKRADRLESGDSLMPLHRCKTLNHRVRYVCEVSGTEDVYDITVDKHHNFALANGAFVHNSIGAGKTFTAAIALSYIIYRMSCLRNPQRYYGLANQSSIVFGMYSITKAQASDVGYDKLYTFVSESPYFGERFPFNRRLLTKISFTNCKMQVRCGSREFHALGADLFSLTMDEANFMQKVSARNNDPEARGQAEKLYDAVRMRMKSRYMRPGGSIPGMLFLISSKQDENAFMERRKKESLKAQESKHVKVSEYSVWEVRDQRKFLKPKFYVEIGDRMHGSRVLDAKNMDDAISEARDGADIVEVPGEYREDFVRDVDRSLRDLAGRATYGVSPLIRDRYRITNCITTEWTHPFTRYEIPLSDLDEIQLDEFFKPSAMFTVNRSVYTPRIDPRARRVAHIDIGLTNDALGLAIGHVHGMRSVTRHRLDGTEYVDSVPVIYIDLMLRVIPSKRGEIDLSKVRSFIVSLRDMGLPIWHVSADGYQSRDLVQIMRKANFETAIVSVDRTDEAYLGLKQAIMDDRIRYYEHPKFLQEIEHLERDLTTCTVDHPSHFDENTPGSKDVADGVAGVYHICTINPDAYDGVGTEISGHRPLRTLDGISVGKSGSLTEKDLAKARKSLDELRRILK